MSDPALLTDQPAQTVDRRAFNRFKKQPHHVQNCIGHTRRHVERALQIFQEVSRVHRDPITGRESIAVPPLESERSVAVARELVAALRELTSYSGVPVKKELIRWTQ